MSLINKALKKAQSQNGDPVASQPAPPAGGQPAPHRHGPAVSPVPWVPIMVTMAALVVVLAGVLTVVLWFFLDARSSSAAENAAEERGAATIETISPAHRSTSAEEVPSAPPPPGEPERPSVFADPRPSPEVADTPPAQAAQPAPPPAPAPTLPAPTPPAPTEAPSPPPPRPEMSSEAAERIETVTVDDLPPDPRMVEWLAESTINGVRLAGQNSRLSMNNRHFRIGDVVNFELGLRLRAVQEERVLFEDERGVRYMKRF